MMLLGAILIVPILSTLADEYGRRPITVLCLLTAFVCHIITSFSPNYYILIVLRFIIGAASDTYYSLCSILSCELLPSKSRAWITLVQTIAWVFGMFWVGILSLFIHEWRVMYFASAAPGVLSILYYLYFQLKDYLSDAVFLSTQNVAVPSQASFAHIVRYRRDTELLPNSIISDAVISFHF
ncbi:unnamed protein product [Heligmosomoides polygyrus]|uniref:MFS domain-containing protein n=1 Tax=Heligmosomoides polygyrus TaxID=6339 RepID=A0A183GKM2_HELPZ|nr:unnamed protein product [Heligmosomoides polygyrus]